MAPDIPDWKQKAEKFLEQYADPESKLLDEEAVVYFLSRKVSCNKAVDKIISNWGERIKDSGKLMYSIQSANMIARHLNISIWRLVEWAEIGKFQKHWRGDLNDDTSIFRTKHIYIRYNIIGFANPFFLFRSNIAINLIGGRLNSLLLVLKDFYKSGKDLYHDLFNQSRIDTLFEFNPDLLQLYKTMIAASYVFGACRLNSDIIDKNILSSACEYLLDHQEADGSWGKNCPELEKKIILTSAAIHAISLSKPYGYKDQVEKGKKYLLSVQDSNGSWPSPKLRRFELSPVYSTVFALDAIELAEGGNQVTFSLPKDLEIDSIDTQDELNIDDFIKVNESLQQLKYKKRTIHIGGTEGWSVLKALLDAKGGTVSYERLNEITGRKDYSAIIGELKRTLKNQNADKIADAIKNQRGIGYYIDIHSL